MGTKILSFIQCFYQFLLIIQTIILKCADILICADVCIPESGKISSNLLDIESDSLIYEWLESIPSKFCQLQLLLTIIIWKLVTFEKEIKEIYFFPDENNSIDYSSKQNFYKKDDDYFLLYFSMTSSKMFLVYWI